MIAKAYKSDIDSEGYYATPFLSHSMITKVRRGTLADWDIPIKDSPAMALGRASHALNLENIDPPRTLPASSRKLAYEMRDALFENESVRNLFRMEHQVETSYFGELELGPEKLKEKFRARLDYQNEFASGDLKFTAEEGTCNRKFYIEKWGLHIQAGFYQQVRSVALDEAKKPFFLVVCHYKPVIWIEILTFEQNWCDAGLSIFMEWSKHIARRKRDENYPDPRYKFTGAQKIEGTPTEEREYE